MVSEPFGTRGRSAEVVGDARALVTDALTRFGLDNLADDAALVTSELVTNAVLHGDGVVAVRAEPLSDGLRIEVEDRTRVPPVMALANPEATTGRGLLLVSSIAARWGADSAEDGKVVWAELIPGHVARTLSDAELLDLWDDDDWGELEAAAETRHRIVLGQVPTDLLLEAKTHVDNLVRELTLQATGAASGSTAALPPHLAGVVDAVVTGFSEARQAIKRQAVDAARRGDDHVELELSLPASAADAGLAYLDALDEADAYSRAARLLTLETPPQHRVFRQWYVGELVRKLRAAAAGAPVPASETFEQRLLREIDAVAEAQVVSARTARLFEVTAALSRAATPVDVAAAVLEQGVAALRASGGGLVLAAGHGGLEVPGTVGYDESVVAGLRAESLDAELPAAFALRTGEPVWLESREERDARFPELVGLERGTVAMCAVPLIVEGRRLGALRFSFTSARLFDEQERRFVVALATQTAQALDRAMLHEERLHLSGRLQRSLLPGQLPDIPGLDLAGIYHPVGHGVEVGGDFYDVWRLADDRFAFAIGDAMGTGPEAAALGAMVRFTLRALTVAGMEPVAALERLNETMLDATNGDAFGERFCSVVLGVVTAGERPRLLLASGGHTYPMLRRRGAATGDVELGGSLLGLLEDAPLATCEVELEPDDVLVLMTDGATEARRDGVMLGEDGVRAAVDAAGESALDVASAIEAAVVAHTAADLTDDLAVLVLHATPA